MEKRKRQKHGKERLTKQDLGKPTKRYTCIVCPNCCELETDGSRVVGALCPKGEEFACQEWVSPRRVITTTVPARTPSGPRRVPVKSAVPVPLSEVPVLMRQIKALRLPEVPPIGSGIPIRSGTDSLDLVVTGD
ncbi:MAG: DUF1667 domain-containing protein [Thermodesulfobacteriota bacterium]